MFTSLRQSRNRQAGVSARVSMMHANACVATIPAFQSTAWTFGYTKPRQRPQEHSH